MRSDSHLRGLPKKCGSESTVRIAAANLVPTDANLLPEYSSFAEYRRACEHFCDEVNTRPHRATRCPPIERLAQERERLHPLPTQPYTAAFGVGRKLVEIVPVIQFDGGEYSVPDHYVSQEVWVRQQDDEIVIVHVGRDASCPSTLSPTDWGCCSNSAWLRAALPDIGVQRREGSPQPATGASRSSPKSER